MKKKTNFITLLLLVLFIAVAIAFMLFREMPSASYREEAEKEASVTVKMGQGESASEVSGAAVSGEAVVSGEENIPETAVPETTAPETADIPEDTDISSDNVLFIGDSRTVGLMEYGGIDGADFFANVGMSLYNMHKKPLPVPGIGRVTLTELLDSKQYGKIYIMLGINELGYDFDRTTGRYKELISLIKEKQPEARLFLQANLHVDKDRSDSDKIINNRAIDRRNAAIAELADNKKIFYLDANVLFDDENGNLVAEKNEDTVHLYAKYYAEWADWIGKQTVRLTGED